MHPLDKFYLFIPALLRHNGYMTLNCPTQWFDRCFYYRMITTIMIVNMHKSWVFVHYRAQNILLSKIWKKEEAQSLYNCCTRHIAHLVEVSVLWVSILSLSLSLLSESLHVLDEGAAQLSCTKLTAVLPRPAPLADGRRPALWFWKGIKRLLEPTRHSLMHVFLHQHSLSTYCVQVLHCVLNIGWGQDQSCPQSGGGNGDPVTLWRSWARAVGRQLGGVTNSDPDLGLEWKLLDNPGSLGVWRTSSLHFTSLGALIRPRLGGDSPDILDPGFPKPELRPQHRLASGAPGIIICEDANPLSHS